jgi:hypothetical protein
MAKFISWLNTHVLNYGDLQFGHLQRLLTASNGDVFRQAAGVSRLAVILARRAWNAEEQLARYAAELREKDARLEENLETAPDLQHASVPQ